MIERYERERLEREERESWGIPERVGSELTERKREL